MLETVDGSSSGGVFVDENQASCGSILATGNLHLSPIGAVLQQARKAKPAAGERPRSQGHVPQKFGMHPGTMGVSQIVGQSFSESGHSRSADSQVCGQLFDSYMAGLFRLAENKHCSGKTLWDALSCGGEAQNGGEVSKWGRRGDRDGETGRALAGQMCELMMLALVRAFASVDECLRALRAFASVTECLRASTSVCKRPRAFTSVCERIFLKVNINSWSADVLEADGVKGAGHVHVAEERAVRVDLAMEYGKTYKNYYLFENIRCNV